MELRFFLFFCSFWTLNNAACPTGTFPDLAGIKCYSIIKRPDTFSSAQNECKTQGGYLASIPNAFENSKLTDEIQQNMGNTQVWLGGNDLSQLGAWQWVDGSNMTYKNWGKNEPNNASPLCVALDSADGFWYTKACDLRLPFVCENPPMPCKNLCPSDGWTYSSKTNSCYKSFLTYFLNSTQSFNNLTDAENICQKYNGHLVSIHNQDENDFLTDAFFDRAYIGLTYNAGNGNFAWIDNTAFDYKFWKTQLAQPDTTDNQYCAYLDTTVSGGWF